MSILNCSLDLIYPPISNQEGVWLWEDDEVKEYVKKSKLYMLVQRKELKYIDIDEVLLKKGVFKFKISMGEIISEYFIFPFWNNLFSKKEEISSFYVEVGDKFFRIKTEDSVIYWATPDKILYDIITKRIHLETNNEKDIAVFQEYELLYVGISKKNDSFSRLFETAHHGRLNILSNESTKEETARMTDELMILLFEIKWFNINTMDCLEHEYDWFTYTDDEDAITADAEKAYVSLLKSKYNDVKFKQYPKGADGLYDKGLNGYIYSINYDLRLYTEQEEISGKYEDLDRDGILVQKNTVKIIKSKK